MRPTVLIFLKAPVAGGVKTRIAAELGDDVAVAIYRGLVEAQMGAIPADYLVEVHYAPTTAGAVMKAWLGERPGRTFWPQPELGLGQRLQAALAGAFERGAASVLLIGGDCPDLDGAVLEAAAASLETFDAVLGPAMDGGFYLLGLAGPWSAVFEGVAWSTAMVAAQVRRRLQHDHHTWVELAELGDIDTAADWLRWCESR